MSLSIQAQRRFRISGIVLSFVAAIVTIALATTSHVQKTEAASSFFTSSFPGSADAALPAGWTQNASAANGTWLQDGTGGAYLSSGSTPYWASVYNSVTPPGNDYHVDFDFDVKTDISGQPDYSGIMIHSDTSSFSGVWVLWSPDNGYVLMESMNGGTEVTNRVNVPFSALGTIVGIHHATVTVAGSLYTLTIGGQSVSFTDSTHGVAPGKISLAGISIGTAQTASTGTHIKNIVATDDSSPSAAADPTISLAAGSYAGTQSTTISTATSGASIRYTTDGSTPTSTTGTVYTGAITIASSETIKAIAYKAGITDSAVVSAAYTITAGPVTTALPNANVYSPAFRQDSTNGYIQSNGPAGKIMFGVTGSATVAMKVTSADYGRWVAYVDGVAQSSVKISPNTSSAVTLASGISTSGIHQITILQTQIGNDNEDYSARWGTSGTPPTASVQVNNIVTAAGSTISASTAIPSKTAIWMTDSIGEYNSAGPSGYQNDSDATKSYPTLLSNALGWYGIMRTYGGQTYYQDRTGSGIAPPVYTPGDDTKTTIGKWDYQNTMTSGERNAVNYVILAQGTNDEQGGVSGANLQERVRVTVLQAHTLFPNAKIFVQAPLEVGTGSDLSSYIQAGFNAAAVPGSVYIPVNLALYSALTFDGVHPTQAAQATAVSTDLLAKYQNALLPTATSIAVTPATPTVASGATQAFTAAVSGNNSPSQTVTWTTTAGTINATTGVLTAPFATASPQTITVTAHSTVTGYTSVTGTATVTIPASSAVTSIDYGGTTFDGGGTIDKRATFSGTALPGSTVVVTVHSDPITCTTTADASGNWSCTLPSDLPNGSHTVLVAVTPAGGGTTVTYGPYNVTVTNGVSPTITPNTGLKPQDPTVFVSAAAAGILLIGFSAFMVRRTLKARG